MSVVFRGYHIHVALVVFFLYVVALVSIDKKLGLSPKTKPITVIKYVQIPAPTPKPTYLTQLEHTKLTIKRILAFEEGFRLKPYLCSAGYVTIGFGTKLHNLKGMNPANFPLTINEKIATEMLNDDLEEVINALQRSKHGKTFNGLSQTRKDIIISMAYQLGVSGVMKFKKTWKYLAAEMYDAAAVEMLDSKWNLDTPERAGRHAIVMADDRMNVYHIYF